MAENSTWAERLKAVIGPSGYADSFMRRSLQTVVLFEAMRCIEPHLEILRPFQRRALLMMQIRKLLDSLDFLTPQQKVELLWRTEKSREPLTDDQAWSRYKTNQKYLRKTIQHMQTFKTPGKSHEEAVDAMIRQAYEEASASKSSGGSASLLSTPPPQWEFFHNHTILTLRLYFNGDQLEVDFPRMEPDVALVPLEKPSGVAKDPPEAPSLSVGDDVGDSSEVGPSVAASLPAVELTDESSRNKRQRAMQLKKPLSTATASKEDDTVDFLVSDRSCNIPDSTIHPDSQDDDNDEEPEPSLKKRAV